MKLDGKVAIVTGSSRGIGRGIAERFAREGARVVINYVRNERAAKEALAAVQAHGREAHLVQADVSEVEESARLVEETVAKFGRVDVLVNNAGIERKAAFWDVTEEDWDKVQNVNLKGVFFTTQAFVKHLRRARHGGKVVSVSSVHEDLPFPGFSSYCASKGGLRMLTRTLAVELAACDVTVNAIAPGAIETDINRELKKDPERMAALVAQIPLKRMGQPGDVAGLAAFLASSDADYVTGSTFFVDGGLTWNYEE